MQDSCVATDELTQAGICYNVFSLLQHDALHVCSKKGTRFHCPECVTYLYKHVQKVNLIAKNRDQHSQVFQAYDIGWCLDHISRTIEAKRPASVLPLMYCPGMMNNGALQEVTQILRVWGSNPVFDSKMSTLLKNRWRQISTASSTNL